MIHIDIYTNVMSVAGGLIIILAFVLYGQRILYDHTAPNGTDEDGKKGAGAYLADAFGVDRDNVSRDVPFAKTRNHLRYADFVVDTATYLRYSMCIA